MRSTFMHIDFICIECGKKKTELHKVAPTFDDAPKCECGEVMFIAEKHAPARECGVSFKGLSTPGRGTSSSPNFNNLPGEIRSWAKHKYEQDRHFENEVKKPMEWPDGTYQPGIK